MAIDELLREQDIVLGMAVKGKRSALARIAAWLGAGVGVGEAAVLEALLHRERLGSTGIGHGVAIPHARVDRIAAPAAMLATLEKPVWFDSPDGNPVDLVLTLLWPKSDIGGFLPALANSCRLLRSADLRERLRAAETAADALAWLRLCARQPAAQPVARQESDVPRMFAAEIGVRI